MYNWKTLISRKIFDSYPWFLRLSSISQLCSTILDWYCNLPLCTFHFGKPNFQHTSFCICEQFSIQYVFYHQKKKKKEKKKEIYLLLHSNWHFHPCLTANSQVVTIIEDIKFRSSTQVDFAIQILRGPSKTSNWVWWNNWTRFLTWNANSEGAFNSKATSKPDLTSANPILSDHLQVGGSSKASDH